MIHWHSTLVRASSKPHLNRLLTWLTFFDVPTVIVVWICFGTTLLSFFLAALTSRHIGKYGPEDTTVGHYVSKHQPGPGVVVAGSDGVGEKTEAAHVERV